MHNNDNSGITNVFTQQSWRTTNNRTKMSRCFFLWSEPLGCIHSQSSQQQKLKFQDQGFSRFQDNFGTFYGLKNLSTHTISLRVTQHKSVINIKKAVIHYNITNKVDEILVLPCIRILKNIKQPHFMAKLWSISGHLY